MNHEEARKVVEQAQHLRDLCAHHAWPALVAYVNNHADKNKERILSGACVDIEEYRKHTGWLEGAKFVLDAADRSEQSARIARGVLNKGA